MTVDEVTSEESKAENKYDTRGLEASYLARGQAERIVALRRQVGWLGAVPAGGSRVGLGSLVQLEEDGTERWVLVVPEGGGSKVEVDGVTVHSVTPRSPLGQGLVGCEEGDAVEIDGTQREIEIVSLG